MKDRIGTRALSRLAALGLGLGLLVACGGKVLFVTESTHGGGGGGAGGSGTTSSSSGSGGPFTCGVPLPPGAQAMYACLATNGQGICDPHDSLNVFQGMTTEIGTQSCGGGCCSVLSVPCGPDPSQKGECCYIAYATAGSCPGG
jgi:hypothetical protein